MTEYIPALKPSFVPAHHQAYTIGKVLPIFAEMLRYVMEEAVQSEEVGTLAYDVNRDQVIYHHKLTDLDRSLFVCASEVEQIWVITGSGSAQ